MTMTAPWTARGWAQQAEARLDSALAQVGRVRTAEVRTMRTRGRACIQTAETDAGLVWIKHGYGLPPGEHVVLRELAPRWPDRVPRLVTTHAGTVVMAPIPGRELQPSDSIAEWTAAARSIAELLAGEAEHAERWLEAGVRDRRPAAWPSAVEQLMESPVVRSMEASLLDQLEPLVPDFIERYVSAFRFPPTLVHQDSGCCNIHVTDDGPIIFDWADVVVGHAAYSCDRLLDQVAAEHHAEVVAAFLEPLALGLEEFRAMRRSNVLHEVLRYHDELAWISPEDPAHVTLREAVQSQLRVLVEHETRRR